MRWLMGLVWMGVLVGACQAQVVRLPATCTPGMQAGGGSPPRWFICIDTNEWAEVAKVGALAEAQPTPVPAAFSHARVKAEGDNAFPWFSFITTILAGGLFVSGWDRARSWVHADPELKPRIIEPANYQPYQWALTDDEWDFDEIAREVEAAGGIFVAAGSQFIAPASGPVWIAHPVENRTVHRAEKA